MTICLFKFFNKIYLFFIIIIPVTIYCLKESLFFGMVKTGQKYIGLAFIASAGAIIFAFYFKTFNNGLLFNVSVSIGNKIFFLDFAYNVKSLISHIFLHNIII